MAGPKGGVGVSAPTGNYQGQFTPTVMNLVVLILVEIAAYAGLRWAFRTAHGG